MQNKMRILIGDNTQEFGILCGDILKSEGFDVVNVSKDGNLVIESIKSFSPSIVVMESFMPNFDAIGVMKDIARHTETPPGYVVISNYDNAFVEKEIMESGASYYMLKPISITSLCDRIKSISAVINGAPASVGSRLEDDADLETTVTDVILHLGIPAHVKGYHYIRTSILLSISDSEMLDSVTKTLYPTVARQYNTTSSRVERAIRHAIEIAWDRGDVDVLNSYFGFTINTSRGKPTNSEFIAMISDKLRLKMKNRKADRRAL